MTRHIKIDSRYPKFSDDDRDAFGSERGMRVYSLLQSGGVPMLNAVSPRPDFVSQEEVFRASLRAQLEAPEVGSTVLHLVQDAAPTTGHLQEPGEHKVA